MPRHSTIRWQYLPEHGNSVGYADPLMMLTERERDALTRAEAVIIEEVEAANLERERVYGDVVLSGAEPRVMFDRRGMDPVEPTDPRLAEPSDEPTA